MILFKNCIEKPPGAGMAWILQHPEFVICKVQADRLNERELAASCNLHPREAAIVGIEIVEKKLIYRILDVCCDSFRQDVERELIRVRTER